MHIKVTFPFTEHHSSDFTIHKMASFRSILLLAVMLQVANLAATASVVAAKSAAAAGPEDLLGGLIDHLTSTRTTNRGYKGRCVPRACCSRSFGVDELCTDPEYTCCYGGDQCTSNGIRDLNEFDEYNRDRYRKWPDLKKSGLTTANPISI